MVLTRGMVLTCDMVLTFVIMLAHVSYWSPAWVIQLERRKGVKDKVKRPPKASQVPQLPSGLGNLTNQTLVHQHQFSGTMNSI